MSGRRLRNHILRFIEFLLAPGVCLACGHELPGANSFCCACARRLKPVPNACRYCGLPNPAAGLLCPSCLLDPPRWQQLTAPFQYRGLVRDYLIRLKFSEALYLARALCEQGASALRENSPLPEVLLPVPLHRERLFERGYNQAHEIACVWSRALGVPVERKALQRLRHTPGQSGLSAAQRRDNVRGAFAYAPKREYHHVAIVDDIVTTGSTIDEITRVLHRGGVEFVEVWAIARVYRK